MHSAHHLEPPPVHLATDEVLLGVEYSTPSTIEPRQGQCMLLNVMKATSALRQREIANKLL
jgi:hypothetical protein